MQSWQIKICNFSCLTGLQCVRREGGREEGWDIVILEEAMFSQMESIHQ